MAAFICFMHGDAQAEVDDATWEAFFADLRAAGGFLGGSAIGDGVCLGQRDPLPEVTRSLVGYLRIEARDLSDAKKLMAKNPVLVAGGTVEIRALPRTGEA
ncbi:MAG: hypothetical protein AAGH41_05270 [Pseudomonadota bacterium]